MAKTTLDGVYVGNPKRATARPTAERLLEAFQGLTLTILREVAVGYVLNASTSLLIVQED